MHLFCANRFSRDPSTLRSKHPLFGRFISPGETGEQGVQELVSVYGWKQDIREQQYSLTVMVYKTNKGIQKADRYLDRHGVQDRQAYAES